MGTDQEPSIFETYFKQVLLTTWALFVKLALDVSFHKHFQTQLCIPRNYWSQVYLKGDYHLKYYFDGTYFLAQCGNFAFILSIKDIRPLTLPPPSLLPHTRICVIIFSPNLENIETILTPKMTLKEAHVFKTKSEGFFLYPYLMKISDHR